MLCVSCVADLHKGLNSKRKSLHSECDEFVSHIDAFHSSSGKVTPEGFIGHCCLISKYSTSPSENKLPPEQQPTTCHNMTRDNSKSEGTIIGGCMCLPEFKLLIPTDTTCMDVIGLGSENDPRAKLQGRWHYVIDEEFAAAVASRNVYPKESDIPPDEWTFRDIKMKVPLPHSLTGKDIKKVSNSALGNLVKSTYYTHITGDYFISRKRSSSIHPCADDSASVLHTQGTKGDCETERFE